MKNQETCPEVVSKVAPPYARLIMKMLHVDQNRPNAHFRQRLIDWLTSSDTEMVTSVIENALQTMYSLHAKVLRLRAGFDGEPIPTIASLSDEYSLSHSRIRQLASGRTLRCHVLDRLPKPVKKQVSEPAPLPKQASIEDLNKLQLPIEALELSVRSALCLEKAGIAYVGDLVKQTDTQLMKTKNFSRKSLKEIREILSSMSLALGMSFSEELANAFRKATQPISRS